MIWYLLNFDCTACSLISKVINGLRKCKKRTQQNNLAITAGKIIYSIQWDCVYPKFARPHLIRPPPCYDWISAVLQIQAMKWCNSFCISREFQMQKRTPHTLDIFRSFCALLAIFIISCRLSLHIVNCPTHLFCIAPCSLVCSTRIRIGYNEMACGTYTQTHELVVDWLRAISTWWSNECIHMCSVWYQVL